MSGRQRWKEGGGGPSGGAELHVIVPWKFWGSTEEMGRERRREQGSANAIRALEIESTILPGIFATERVCVCVWTGLLAFISTKCLHPSPFHLSLSLSQFNSK